MSATALPESGYVRLATVLKIYPVCRTKWYEGIKSGKHPRPVALGPRTAAYKVEDIKDLLERVAAESAGR